MNNILITGGAGFIGSHIAEALVLIKTGKIVILDDLSTGSTANIIENPLITFVKGSVTDRALVDSLFREHSFEVIFHMAAIASVQESIRDPLHSHEVNFDSTLYLIEKARQIENFNKFIYASSAAVYGNNPLLPCREDQAVEPISPYGSDKYASERYLINSFHLYGLPATAFRFFNVYGPRQNPLSPYSGVISIFTDRLLKEENDLNVFGDGLQTRDFLFVKDLVDILLFCLDRTSTSGQVYNIGTGTETSLRSLIGILSGICRRKAEIRFLPEKAGDIRRSVTDISKLRSEGYNKIMTPLEKGLLELVEYLRKNPANRESRT